MKNYGIRNYPLALESDIRPPNLARRLAAFFVSTFATIAALSADTPNANGDPTLFVTNNGDESAGAYDPATGAQLTSFLGLKNPVGITVVSGSISGSMTDVVDIVNNNNGTVSQYDTAGNLINPALITGLGQGWSAVSSGNDLYISTGSGTVKEYNAITGQVVNASFITGLKAPFSMAITGNDLYVANFNTGIVSEYDATTGAAIDRTLITGLNGPFGLAIANGELFVSSEGSNSVGAFNLQTGVAINANLVTGVTDPTGVAVWNNNLYVLSSFNGTVGEYDATTGAAINPSFITGLQNPEGISLVQLNIPEPGAWELLAGAAVLGLGLARFRKQPSQVPALQPSGP